MALDLLGLGKMLAGVVDDVYYSDEEKAEDKAKRQALKSGLAERLANQQAMVNALEARHRSLFVAGWRPFVGWVCGVAFAWHFVGRPAVVTATAIWWPEHSAAVNAIPKPDMGLLLTVLGGMLGLGGLRTYEKKKGVTK